MIQDHNKQSAFAWGHAGASYDFISFGLSDGLSHAVQALWPEPGEHILDVATGTGWTARLVAHLGARVTGVDIAAPLLEAARGFGRLHDRLDFTEADAEALPFGDASFDGVVSTYGVIFAGRPEAAAAELARVTRPGGRMVLMTWADDPGGYIPEFFALVRSYADGPPPPGDAFAWGRPDWLHETFGDGFDLAVDEHHTTLFAPDAEVLWEKYRKGFGPMDLTASALSPERLDEFRRDFKALHEPYDTGNGLRIGRKALMVRGRRRA